MKLKHIILLLGCTLFSISLVVTLYAISDNHLRKHNSFLRIILKNPMHHIGGVNLKYNSYYIAGGSEDKVYFGNYTGPLYLLTSGFNLTDTQHVKLTIRNIDKLKFHSPRLNVVPPYFYIMDGPIPGLYRGKVNEWLADTIMSDKAAYFIDAVPVGMSSFAIRSTRKLNNEHVLGKIMTNAPYLKLDTTMLQKQIDGRFCTDGKLLYDHESARIVYLYHYRNQYIVSDTSLNLLYRGTTIDTVSHAQFTTSSITSEKSYTMSSPPLVVNEASCVYNGLLFIKSPLLSKNELEETFRKVSVLDVYDLKDGTYKFSFYVPRSGGKSMREFKIYNNTLIVMYDQRVETHELNPDYFPKQNIPGPQMNGL